MDLARMLERCRSGQWSLDDVDWSRPPRPMSPADEEAFVQYFTNMAGIELLAAALFREQREQARDPVLRDVFHTFVVDEERHSAVAARLARHFDVRRLRRYEPHPALVRFTPHFVAAVRFLSAEVANVYITTGELILDVALLRSLNDAARDPTCSDAIERVNRDESRHIAVDFHMVEYYASEAYRRAEAARPAPGLRRRLAAWWALAHVFYYASPFFREVFFDTMDRVDPDGRRLLEAFKRIQLLNCKPEVSRRPFTRFLRAMQWLFETPLTRPVLGRLAVRVLGVQGRVLETLYTAAEARWAREASFDALAEEALGAKLRA